MLNRSWYQTLIDNPDVKFKATIKEFKDNSFIQQIISKEDVIALKNANVPTIHKQLDKLDEPKEIKMLMKQIFKA
jgi:hypothetical protein